jgi:hypothetical protein
VLSGPQDAHQPALAALVRVAQNFGDARGGRLADATALRALRASRVRRALPGVQRVNDLDRAPEARVARHGRQRVVLAQNAPHVVF